MVIQLLSFYLVVLLATPTVAYASEEEQTEPDYVVLQVEAGDIVPFDGVLLSLDAAAKVLTGKRFEDAECSLRVEY